MFVRFSTCSSQEPASSVIPLEPEETCVKFEHIFLIYLYTLVAGYEKKLKSQASHRHSVEET
ncbi:hypothetical protein HanIR_Chr08g0345221 [Helianthus annuus]|nr:hypothetical protein HanIR_Chr08g0345221 [Helianthus annuus]